MKKKYKLPKPPAIPEKLKLPDTETRTVRSEYGYAEDVEVVAATARNLTAIADKIDEILDYLKEDQ